MKYKNSIIPEIFASIMASIAGLIIYVSRIGFENYGFVIIQTIFLSYFVIFGPNILNYLILKHSYKQWFTTKPFILLNIVILLVFIGQVSIYIDTILLSIFTVIGGCLLVISLVKKEKSFTLKNSLYFPLLFILLGVCFTLVQFIDYYSHPLIKEKIITGAWAHRDAVWFSGMAGMFKTYGVSSSGIDGLVPLYYHTFSHFVYGSLSGLLGVNTITFFYICAPILITPIFFLSFIFCVKDVGEYFSKRSNITRIDESHFKFWVALSVLFLLPLPYQIIGYFGGERYEYITSTSYSFALFLTFIFVSVIFSFINTDTEIEYVSSSNKSILALTSILFLLAISLSKVSFLLILGFIYCYIFLRFKYYRNLYHIFTMTGCAAVFVLVFYLIIYTETFLMNEAQINSQDSSLTTYTMYIFPSILYIVIRLLSEKNVTLNSLYIKLKLGSFIELEILVALAIVLFVVPVQYFKGVQIYFAYILIMSQLHIFELKNINNT